MSVSNRVIVGVLFPLLCALSCGQGDTWSDSPSECALADDTYRVYLENTQACDPDEIGTVDGPYYYTFTVVGGQLRMEFEAGTEKYLEWHPDSCFATGHWNVTVLEMACTHTRSFEFGADGTIGGTTMFVYPGNDVFPPCIIKRTVSGEKL